MTLVNLSKSSPTKFQLVFQKFPEESTLSDHDQLKLNITETVLPSLTLTALEVPYRGAIIKTENGGLEFGEWTVRFLIDNNFSNWTTIYNWIISINNADDVFGKENQSYTVDANLHVLDNFNNKVLDIQFLNTWPTTLGDVTLSYQNNETILICDCTFVYDRYEKK